MYLKTYRAGVLLGLIFSALAPSAYAGKCADEYKAAYEKITAATTNEGAGNESLDPQTKQITEIFYSVFQKCLGDVKYDFKAAQGELGKELTCRQTCFESQVKGKILVPKLRKDALACYNNCYADVEPTLKKIEDKLEDNKKKIEEMENNVIKYEKKKINGVVEQLTKTSIQGPLQVQVVDDPEFQVFEAQLVELAPPLPEAYTNFKSKIEKVKIEAPKVIEKAIVEVEKKLNVCTDMANKAKGGRPKLDKDYYGKNEKELKASILNWSKYYGNLQQLAAGDKKVDAYMKRKGWPWVDKDLEKLDENEIKAYYECLKPHKQLLLNLSKNK